MKAKRAAVPSTSARIKVRATGKGTYPAPVFREPGDVFFLDKEEDFSAKWMEKLSKSEEPK